MKRPKDVIYCSRTGYIEAVETFYVVNNISLGVERYRRQGKKFFQHFFDEHHEVSREDEIPKGKVPSRIQKIFGLGTREVVEALKKQRRLRNYQLSEAPLFG